MRAWAGLVFCLCFSLAHAERRLLPGDTVEIRCPESASYCVRRTLSPDGSIGLPGLPPVNLAKLTPTQAADRISELLTQAGRLADARTEVVPAENRRRTATLSGQVSVPGEYSVGDHTTLLDLLNQAKPAADADFRHIVIDTAQSGVLTVDALAQPWRVRPGDRIQVSAGIPRREVFVLGGVERPGAIEFSEEMNVADALRLAGGLSAHGSRSGWVVRREGISDVKVDLEGATTVTLKPGDTLEVPLVADRTYVAVTGAVSHPGGVAFRAGIKLTAVIAAAGGPSPDGDVSSVEIRSLGGRVIRVNLTAVLSGKKPDPVLKLGDTVIVPRLKRSAV